MMRLLKNPDLKTVEIEENQCPKKLTIIESPYGRNIELVNYFHKYAYDSNERVRSLKFEDLLEFLQRVVFKAACIITYFE